MHVLRDGRAVANSLINVHFWDGTENSWWWGPMDEEYEREYQDSKENRAVLAGIVWKTLVEIIEGAFSQLPEDRRCTIRYDEILRSPRDATERLCNFCDLDPSPRFMERISRIDIRGADDKWRLLPWDERQGLQRSVEPFMERMGLPL